jgi:hypothetical protein
MSDEIADHLALKRLLALYDRALDDGDTDGFRALFTPDGTVETDDGSWSGDGLATFVARSAAPDGTAVQHRHDHPELRQEGDHWFSRSFGMTVQVSLRGGFGNGSPSLVWLGYHDDELARTSDGWLFIRRTSRPWVGDILSGFAPAERRSFS